MLPHSNLGGIMVQEEADCCVCFERVDFGETGADEVTIPIFMWSDDPLPLEFWEGMPNEPGSELLLAANYSAEKQWNTYKPNTFKLPRRLRGLHDFTIRFNHKLHLHGFQFKRIEKAYDTIRAVDNNLIYGDSYTVTPVMVERIGNNVSLEFTNMDFGDGGCARIVISGRSHGQANTIHVRFTGDGEDIKQIVEFPVNADVTERSFGLTPVRGKKKVTFVFMPGSNFDFEWFRFER
jgi:beta-galactosidase